MLIKDIFINLYIKMFFLLYSIPSWFYYNFIEYNLHSSSHNSYIKYIHKIHKKHHTIHYPISNLIQKSPYKTEFHNYIFSDGFIILLF